MIPGIENTAGARTLSRMHRPGGYERNASFLSRLGAGTALFREGFSFLGARRRLWGLAAIPVLFAFIAVGGVATTFFLEIAAIHGFFDALLPTVEAGAWYTWLWVGPLKALFFLGGWLAVIVAFAVSLVAAMLLANLASAPFLDLLSEKVEKAHFGLADPGRPFSALLTDIGRSLLDSLSLLARWGLVMVVLFALSFTAVGAPLFAVASWYYLGLAQLDITLARKLYKAGQRTAWARRHFPLVVGLGLPVAFVPLLAPFAIVGATLAFLDEPDKA